MIRELNGTEKEKTLPLWKKVFPEDEERFLDFYFRRVAEKNRVFADEEQGEIVSMAHFNPYRLWNRGMTVPSYYIVSVATGEAFRHQGRMSRVLQRGLRAAAGEHCPFVFLLPVDPAIYEPLGFVCFERPEDRAQVLSAGFLYDLLALKREDYETAAAGWQEVLTASRESFCLRDAQYLELLLGEYQGEREVAPPEPLSLHSRMGRIADVESFLKLGRSEEAMRFSFRYEDPLQPEQNGAYRWDLTADGASGTRLEETSGDLPLLGPGTLFPLVFDGGEEETLPLESPLRRIKNTYYIEEI